MADQPLRKHPNSPDRLAYVYMLCTCNPDGASLMERRDAIDLQRVQLIKNFQSCDQNSTRSFVEFCRNVFVTESRPYVDLS